ncbi:MAG TPA: succinate dehydrogenase cytochrome b subunit [Chitinophagaceae bacterium]|jgi:succinate dehydrogenase / fumarate reductase cytochrome b subunit
MKWSEFFTSSVGKKFVMALSGLFLIAFLVVHVTVNACIWAKVFDPGDNGEVFNKAAHWLGQTLVPRILEIGLFIVFIIHIIQGYVLEVQNRQRRGVGYHVKMGSRGSAWYRKSMGLLGTIIFLFLIVHLADFWVPSRFGGLDSVSYPDTPGKEYHQLYGRMIEVFQNPWIVALYVIGCISLLWHLVHGFESSFRSLGVSNKRYLAMLNATGWIFSVIVCLGFALMPVSVYAGWIQ